MDLDRLFEFVGNHWQLVGAFIGALLAWFMYETRKQGQTVTPQQLIRQMNQDGALVIDLRDSKDYRNGHITGAKNIPYADLKDRIVEISSKNDHPVILVCGMGQYAGAAGKLLLQNGFKNVSRLSGGVSSWSAQGLPLVKGKS